MLLFKKIDLIKIYIFNALTPFYTSFRGKTNLRGWRQNRDFKGIFSMLVKFTKKDYHYSKNYGSLHNGIKEDRGLYIARLFRENIAIQLCM
jgi:hypothetical protein